MRIVIPHTITESDILESSLELDTTTYPGLAVYDSSKTYAKDEYCYLVSDHQIYQSATDSNINHNPPDYLSGLDTTFWKKIGPINTWAVFDSFSSTQSVASTAATVDTPSIITLKLTAAQCDALFFTNLNATQIAITVKDKNGVVRDESTTELVSRGVITNWWEFFFNKFVVKSTLLLTMPYRWDSTVDISIVNTNPGEKAACGQIVIGAAKELGKTPYKCSMSSKDYSLVSTNQDGVTTIVKRSVKTYIEVTVDSTIDTISLDELNKTLDRVTSVPTVWDFNNVYVDNGLSTVYESLMFFGLLSDKDISPQSLRYNQASIKVSQIVGISS